jgi:hypothetical protein
MVGVPESLAKELIRVGAKHAGTPGRQRMAMAYPIISYYLGNPWYAERACLHKKPDPFMVNEIDEESENRWVYQDRLVGLADALFQLRDCQNFDVLCERFQGRETKPCFTEAIVAKSLSKDGFEVEIVRESGAKGKDFDLLARKGSLEISVEVTAKDAPELTVATIRNTLDKKRKQVAADRPAILYMIIPEEWTENGAEAERIFSEAMESHFRNSQTFNAVCVVWYAKIVLGDGRIFVLTYCPFEHPSPRHPIEDLSFLRPDNPIGDLDHLRNRVKTDSEGLTRELDDGRGGTPPSFFEWYSCVTQGD